MMHMLSRPGNFMRRLDKVQSNDMSNWLYLQQKADTGLAGKYQKLVLVHT